VRVRVRVRVRVQVGEKILQPARITKKTTNKIHKKGYPPKRQKRKPLKKLNYKKGFGKK
jgi:hypothetical protein